MAVMNNEPAAEAITAAIGRRLLGEALGSGLLVAVVVGSGIAAQRLSPNEVGVQLLENSLATALGLAVLITLFGPISGAHFNPVVSVADWFVGRRRGSGLAGRVLGGYVLAQVVGGTLGALLANAMYGVAPAVATTERVAPGTLLGEVVATAVLVLLIFGLAATGRSALAAPAVGAYIGAAYWFTSSTSFANPAVTIARMFSDTFAGIAPTSVLPFVLAQCLGAAIGVALTLLLFPAASRAADRIVLPHAVDDAAI